MIFILNGIDAVNLFLTHQPHDTGYQSPHNVQCQANAQGKKSIYLQSPIRREYILKVINDMFIYVKNVRVVQLRNMKSQKIGLL